MSTQVGNRGEDIVVEFLRSSGHTIKDRNWKTRWCEIDIVSIKDGVVYFVEVKFRSSDAWGSGFDYVTPKKLQQMKFAAEFWLSENKYNDESTLAAAEVDSSGNVDFIEIET